MVNRQYKARRYCLTALENEFILNVHSNIIHYLNLTHVWQTLTGAKPRTRRIRCSRPRSALAAPLVSLLQVARCPKYKRCLSHLRNVYLSLTLSPSKCRPPPAVKPIMETTTHLSPTTTTFDTMASPDAHNFLKLEDVHNSSSPPATSFDNSGSTPPPVIVTSRQAKKRKSWGQELPEPKTTLPPRKRAKTDDEKEQRRIERIKRNRAAAHNSRERKRQETETLAVALARANAELDAYRRLHGPLPPSVVLPEVTVCTERYDLH